MKKIGFLHLLTLLFIGLKLTGYVSWSWLWVLSPLWIYGSLVLSLNLLLAVWQVREEERSDRAWDEMMEKLKAKTRETPVQTFRRVEDEKNT